MFLIVLCLNILTNDTNVKNIVKTSATDNTMTAQTAMCELWSTFTLDQVDYSIDIIWRNYLCDSDLVLFLTKGGCSYI